ncbi:ATP-binding cassette domain-containing protein [Ruegeria sp.]|uniref:ATP-binding cassette domain-containing protein n=1 Tax=Ruegeria sp. TaxID=1879320 RepID=UPI00231B6C4C|nr:ATP-binding cassette domain-containing protein [Ruegeria sp.]MDA7966521.1 ATP-binding cassette domain-containing protein [Ruegeria sp.]
MSDPVLQVENLPGGYDPVQIFQEIDLILHQGESAGIFGPNGHGKTTFLKMLSGLIDPWSGTIRFHGVVMNRAGDRGSRKWRNFNYDAVTRRRMDPKKVARAGLIHVQQRNLLFPELTVDETLSISSEASGGRDGWALDQVRDLFPRRRAPGAQDPLFVRWGTADGLGRRGPFICAPLADPGRTDAGPVPENPARTVRCDIESAQDGVADHPD